jgi:hypothetical protein
MELILNIVSSTLTIGIAAFSVATEESVRSDYCRFITHSTGQAATEAKCRPPPGAVILF